MPAAFARAQFSRPKNVAGCGRLHPLNQCTCGVYHALLLASCSTYIGAAVEPHFSLDSFDAAVVCCLLPCSIDLPPPPSVLRCPHQPSFFFLTTPCSISVRHERQPRGEQKASFEGAVCARTHTLLAHTDGDLALFSARPGVPEGSRGMHRAAWSVMPNGSANRARVAIS